MSRRVPVLLFTVLCLALLSAPAEAQVADEPSEVEGSEVEGSEVDGDGDDPDEVVTYPEVVIEAVPAESPLAGMTVQRTDAGIDFDFVTPLPPTGELLLQMKGAPHGDQRVLVTWTATEIGATTDLRPVGEDWGQRQAVEVELEGQQTLRMHLEDPPDSAATVWWGLTIGEGTDAVQHRSPIFSGSELFRTTEVLGSGLSFSGQRQAWQYAEDGSMVDVFDTGPPLRTVATVDAWALYRQNDVATQGSAIATDRVEIRTDGVLVATAEIGAGYPEVAFVDSEGVLLIAIPVRPDGDVAYFDVTPGTVVDDLGITETSTVSIHRRAVVEDGSILATQTAQVGFTAEVLEEYRATLEGGSGGRSLKSTVLLAAAVAGLGLALIGSVAGVKWMKKRQRRKKRHRRSSSHRSTSEEVDSDEPDESYDE